METIKEQTNKYKIVFFLLLMGLFLFLSISEYFNQLLFVENQKKTVMAIQGCDQLDRKCQIYNSLEEKHVSSIQDMMGKFVSGIDLRDPWGNPYQLDPYGGFVFSMGPDGKHHRTNKRHQWNLDDVLIPYIGALGIETASIECNPLKEKDKWLARDVLHLVFNKPVTIVKNSFPFVMNNISDNNIKDGLICNNHQLESIVANYQADLASPRFCFRWCKGESDFYIDGSKILQQPNGIADTHEVTYGGSGDPASVWTGTMPCKLMSISDGKMFHTKKSMEVVIVLPKGTSGSILPDTHYINLTGNIKNKYGNTLFREFDQITPAVISSSPHLIKRYEKKNSQL